MAELSVTCDKVLVSYSLNSVKVSTLKEYLVRKGRGELSKIHKVALDHVSFQAKKGECVALIGHNGCGKSTLLKCIAGILTPKSGIVETHGRIAPMIELGAGFDPEMTGRENVYLSCSLLGLTKMEIEAKIPEIERFAELGMFFDAPVKTYSSGMYMRLGFAATTAIEAEIVLIDEILAVGDENFQKKCFEKISSIRHSGSTVILVSHDLSTVSRMADRVYVMDNGHVVHEGLPAPSIQFYYQLMEEKRLASITVDEREEELRKKRLLNKEGREELGFQARIIDAKIDQGMVKNNNLNDLNLMLEVELFQDFNAPVIVGFALHDAQDRRIFGGNTKIFGEYSGGGPRLKGKYIIDFKFEDLSLASGRYKLIVAIHNNALDTTLDLQKEAAELSVSNEKDPFNFDRNVINPFSILSSHHVEKLSQG